MQTNKHMYVKYRVHAALPIAASCDRLNKCLTQTTESCFSANDAIQHAVLKPGWAIKFSQQLVDKKTTLVFSCVREERGRLLAEVRSVKPVLPSFLISTINILFFLISTYSNAYVICYSATWRAELNEQNFIRRIVNRSLKNNFSGWSYDKTDEARSFLRHSNMMTLGWKCRTRATPPCDIIFACRTDYRASSV